jgi:hypothetical protein
MVGKLEGKEPIRRPGCRWKDDIKMDLKEVGCKSMYWSSLAQDRGKWRALVNTVMNLQVL